MKTSILIGAGALLTGLVATVPAMAFTGIVYYTEDIVSGIVVDYPTSSPAIVLASDGEARPFDPFGAGYDTSDGIQLNSNWTQIAGNSWVNIGNDTYVIPACVGGTCENGPVPEDVGIWLFPGAAWGPQTPGAVYLMEWDGTTSDIIKVWNDSHGAWISFNSSVPEPSTWAMMLLGFAGLGFAGYRVRARAFAPAL